MPSYQGGLPTGTSSAPGPGTTTKTRAGVAVGTSSAPRGRGDKVYAVATIPSSSGAVAPTGRPTKGWPGRPGVGVSNTFAGIPVPIITDAEFDEAERRSERWPVWNLQVDWTSQDYTGVAADLGDCIRSVEVERAITGELPDEAGVVDGYATGTLSAELGGYRPGAALPLAAELSPFRTDSPLFGRTLVTPTTRIDMGLLTDAGPKSYRQLTGPVRTLRIGERDQTVSLQAVDPSERIRELITLPTYGEFVTHASRRNWAITTNTQGVVDHVVRKNGIFASPPPRADAIISCTGHGALFAERGFNGAPISLPGQVPRPGLWTDDEHPYRMLGSPEPRDANGTVGYQELYGVTDGYSTPFKYEAGYGVGVSMLAHLGSWMGFPSTQESRLVQVRPGDIYRDNADNETPRLFVNWWGNGDIYAGLVGTNGTVYATPRIPTGASKWRHLGFHWRMASATSMVVTVRVDATTRTYTITIPAQVPVRGYRPTLQVNPQMTRSWSNLQAWVAYDPPAVAEWQALENWTPQAEIGRGINELLYLPDVAAEDSWEVLKAAVGAEFGVHGFTPEGRYFFRPRADTRATKIDVELSVETNLEDVGYTISSDSIRNVIGYSTTPRYHSGQFQAVVSAQDILQFVAPPGITQWDLDWPWGAAGRQGGQLPYYWTDQSVTPPPEPQWAGDVPHGFTYSYGTNWSGEKNPYNVGVYYCQIDSRRVRVTVNNTGSAPVRLATDANVADLAGQPGQPAMNIGGWPMIDLPDHVEEYRDEGSIARYRSPRALALGKSEWRQTPGVLDPVARTLLAAMSEPVSVLEDLPVRGNPRVQVGMVARLRFRGEMTPVTGVIVKTRRLLDANGYTDRVSVRPLPEQSLAPPGWTFYIDSSHHQWQTSAPIDLQRAANVGYAGHVARVGQAAGTRTDGSTNGSLIDNYWRVSRDQSRAIWPETFAGYWYVGGTESPASQASRCAAELDVETRTVYQDAAPDVTRVRTDGPWTLGTRLRLTAHGKLSALRFYRSSTQIGGTIRGCIYPEGSSTPVSGTTVTFALSGTGWQYAYLSTPVTLPPGRYRVAINFPSAFAETDGYWTAGAGRRGTRAGIVAAAAGADTCCFVAGSSLSYPGQVAGAGQSWWADAVVTSTTPIMLDFEDGSGSWSNLLAVLAAFRSAGIAVTMLYTNLQTYAPSNGATTIDASTGLRVINSRYWISKLQDPAQDPRKVFDDILATNPIFGRVATLGATPDALQFTEAGVIYPGLAMDVDAIPGDAVALSDMIYNR